MARKKTLLFGFGADITDLEKKMKQVDRDMAKLSKRFRNYGMSMTKTFTVPLVGIGAYALRESIAFESAFARVRKSVGGTEAELKSMEKAIIDMSKEMPTAAGEIAAVAATAGQLGIQRDKVMGFTKAIIQLGETSNLVGEEGATMAARFANVTQMNQDNFDRLGSTVVALGNSLATTEKDVMELAGRFAATAKIVGMTEPQILALAGSLSSVGIEAQAGGTAFEKLFIELDLVTKKGGKGLKDFADVAGMSVNQFAALFKEDAAGAIMAFIQGLSDLEGTGTSAIEVLDRMGITEVRQRNALLKASVASDIFARSMKIANEAWQQNNELQEKTAIFYQTTGAQLQMLKNELDAVAMEIGTILVPHLKDGMELLKGWTKAFSDLSPEAKETTVKIAAMTAAIGPALIAISALINSIRNVSGAIMALAKGPAAPLVLAAAALIYLAESFEGSKEAAAKFQSEIDSMDLTKLRELQDIASGGLFGAEGWKGSAAIAIAEEKARKELSDARQRLADEVKRDTVDADADIMAGLVPVKKGSGAGSKGSGSSGTKAGKSSGQSAAEKLVQGIRDQIEYLSADGAAFLPVLDEWKAKLKPLSDDWKTIVDLQKEITKDATDKAEETIKKQAEQDKQAIEDLQSMMDGLSWQNSMGLLGDSEYLEHLTDVFAGLKAQLADPGFESWTEPMKELFASIQNLQSDEAREIIDALQLQFETGAIGVEQYRAALEGLKNEFAEFPLAVKMLDQEIKAFDRSVQMATKSIEVMIREAEQALKDKLAGVADELSGAFASAIVYGDDLGAAMQKLAQDIMYAYIKALLLKYVFGPIQAALGFADGGVFSGGTVVPFARGGIVDRPTIFPMAHGMGLMGEAGPEAVMPLERGSDGRLGVSAEGSMSPPVIINVLDRGDLERVTYEAMAKYPGSQIVTNHVLRARSERASLAFGGV